MQRGILELNRHEAQLALDLLNQSSQDTSQLTQRLTMVIDGNEAVSNIEVNREEVEVLLDAMPIPTENEDPRYKVLRSKLSLFLNKRK